MKLEDRIWELREATQRQGRPTIPEALQGVTKQRIARVLAIIDRESPDTIDAVFALLDDQHTSWFAKAKPGTRFCDGASTAHIGCHVGILQRGRTKLDREGRDYWIKPLREVGAIEAVTLQSETGIFVMGHTVAKSSNSAYRLSQVFVDLLRTPDAALEEAVFCWIEDNAIRRRLEVQAGMAQRARDAADTKHSDLIAAARSTYAARFLPNYAVLYCDDGDGDRIPEAARRKLTDAGLDLRLEDAMPDILLWNREESAFWVIEAVTSDGEVDLHKVEQIHRFVHRTRPASSIGFTTAFRTWREAAGRQGRLKNLAPGTYLWILEDASKQFYVEAFDLPRVAPGRAASESQ